MTDTQEGQERPIRTVTFLDPELRRAVEAEAKRESRTISAHIAHILRQQTVVNA